MIRALRPEDLDQVMQIWLDANLEAHCFLPESYWCDHMEEVRAALPAAQVFVYQDWEGLQGFAGLTGDYLAGLFVRRAARSRGIGRALLERAKEGRESLTLHVYRENSPAVRFYQREGFAHGPRSGRRTPAGKSTIWSGTGEDSTFHRGAGSLDPLRPRCPGSRYVAPLDTGRPGMVRWGKAGMGREESLWQRSCLADRMWGPRPLIKNRHTA